MNETIFRNSQLNVTMTKVVFNNEPVVWADDMRDALKWERTDHMVRGLKEGVEYYKVSVNTLKSMGWKFCPNLDKTSGKGGRPQEYVYFVTEQGVTRLIATRRPHDIKDDPALAEWLDKLQNWIFGEVIPSAMKYGAYMTPQVAQSVIENPNNAVALVQKMLAEKTLKCKGLERMLDYRKEAYKNQQNIIVRLQNKCDNLEKFIDEWIPEFRECPDGKRPLVRKGAVVFVDDNGKSDWKNLVKYDRIKKWHDKKHKKFLGDGKNEDKKTFKEIMESRRKKNLGDGK